MSFAELARRWALILLTKRIELYQSRTDKIFNCSSEHLIKTDGLRHAAEYRTR